MTKEEILKDDWVANNYGDRGRNWVNLAFLDGVNWMEERMQESNEGQALLYVVEKTAERTKREVIKKAAEWLDKNVDSYCFNTGNRYEHIPKVGRKMLEDFKQAMQDESK